jgi:2-dehydro-3-deoxyphosphogluconate aldolase / (4S)-4-hydroxy-2-oxoglutarate aldolase
MVGLFGIQMRQRRSQSGDDAVVAAGGHRDRPVTAVHQPVGTEHLESAIDEGLDLLDRPVSLRAGAEGGISTVEITLRTPAGLTALRRIAKRTDLIVGAGTVLNAGQVDAAVDAGAQFIVSPGFSAPVVERAGDLGVLVLPGIATPSELQAAVNAGLSAVKLFPAAQLGGTSMIDALTGPFPDVRFFPSGGITTATASRYLDHPAVFAIGVSWLINRDHLANERFDRITDDCRAATVAVGSPSR